MVRAFTDDDIRQADSGQVEAAANPQNIPLPLPGGTLEGNAAIIVAGGNAVFDPPAQWAKLAAAGSTDDKNPQIIIGVRADVPAGESSWPINFAGGTAAQMLWTIAEWLNVSYSPLVARAFSFATAPSSVSLSAAMQGNLATPYTLAIAAIFLSGSVNATSGWSAVTWSNGFTQTDVLTRGTGQNTGDCALHVARRYGTLDEAGPWTTTATFTGGTQTGKLVYSALAVIRAKSVLGDI